MKHLFIPLIVTLLYGCNSNPITVSATPAAPLCAGSTALPSTLADKFEPVTDPSLLSKALGAPDEGKLCQGQVYRSKVDTEITLFRAWNSTNPNSKMGKWWAFQVPSGPVSQYRAAYEICYQWSPLDKLVRCTLNTGVKVVVGTGQSATCSNYLRYPISETQQIYIDSADQSLFDCTTYNGEFSWREVSLNEKPSQN